MTEAEWIRSEDVTAMLRWFRASWRGTESDLNRLIQRYCLACCRKIWPLLLSEGSRQGVEIAERFLEGRATRDEFGQAEWIAEGAAFHIEQNMGAEPIMQWIERVASIPPEELRGMVRPTRSGEVLSPGAILEAAAYFADFAMCYPGITPKESIDRYEVFLSAPLLREFVGNLSCSE